MPALATPEAVIQRPRRGRPRLINAGQPANPRTRPLRVPPRRIGQNGRQKSGFPAAQIAGGLAEGPPGSGFRAELPIRPPFGDIEIDFHDPPLGQNQVHPEAEREFQRLADVAAARPEKQVFYGLLGNARPATQILEVFGLGDDVPQALPVDPVMRAKTAIFGGDHRQRQNS